MGVKKIINLLIFRAVSRKAIYIMFLYEVLFDYFKNILELTVEKRVKKYTWTCVGTDQGFLGHSSGKSNKPNFLVYPPGAGGGGGYFRNFWVGMCCWDPGTLNLYQS